jgi:PIN domain nuclease of toxin-antitoxin system
MTLRLLLDTNAIIWSALHPRELSKRAAAAIEDPESVIFFSPVSAMEIATKVRIGKLEIARSLATGFSRQMTARDFCEIPLTAEHAELAGSYPAAHNDPWDRLLAAQANLEALTLVTNDPRMADFNAVVLW